MNRGEMHKLSEKINNITKKCNNIVLNLEKCFKK